VAKDHRVKLPIRREVAAITSSWAASSAFLGALLLPTPATAETIVRGGTVINQTWTAANSPYVVQGDVTVPATSTLTIAAGTVVVFPGGDALGSGHASTLTEFLVHGTLRVAGSEAEPALFEAQDGRGVVWGGIWSDGRGAIVDIAHATFRDGYHAVGVWPSVSPATTRIRDAHFEGFTSGIYLEAPNDITLQRSTFSDIYSIAVHVGGGIIDRVAVEGTSLGIRVTGDATLTNILAHDTSDSISLAPGSTTTITNATLDSHAYQGILVYSGAVVDVTNTVITNGQNGIYAERGATVSVSHSNVWNNTAANYTGVSPGAGCISANPQFATPGSDWRLASSSLCIDSGSASAAPDRDLDGNVRPFDGDGLGGATVDMGAYEYGSSPGPTGGGGSGSGGAGNGTSSGSSAGAGGNGLEGSGANGGASTTSSSGAGSNDAHGGDGCSCRVATTSPPTPTWVAVNAAMVAAAERRRRRHRRDLPHAVRAVVEDGRQDLDARSERVAAPARVHGREAGLGGPLGRGALLQGTTPMAPTMFSVPAPSS
jgi:MYXO-CTERM domain-containing protein